MKIILSLLLILSVLLLMATYWSESGAWFESGGVGIADDVLIFLFVNLNIIFLCVLAFLVGRELVKLVVDRRKNILGSRLRWRLVIPFFGLTAIPLLLLFVLASGLLNRAMEGWLQGRMDASRDASVIIAKGYYRELKASVEHNTDRLRKKLEKLDSIAPGKIKRVFSRNRHETFHSSLRLLDRNKDVIAESTSPLNVVEVFQEPPIISENVDDVLRYRTTSTGYEGEGNKRFLRVYSYVEIGGHSAVLLVTHRLDPTITESFQIIRDSYNDNREMKLFHNPLRSGYRLTFGLVAGMILFAALWLVVQIARAIVEPIERLVSGTLAISRGQYDVRIDPGGKDEIGILIQSFNQMAEELSISREQAESQQLLLATILSNLSVGVLAVDRDLRVLLVNKVAQEFVGENVKGGAALQEVLHGAMRDSLYTLLDEVHRAEKALSCNLQFSMVEAGREIRLVCTAGRISDPKGRWIATVLLIDDITELVKAQQMSTWREVARRIAHEIKNPLTPLKLSAQRLQRQAAKSQDPNNTLWESTQTIVEHVESIKRLADEFSNFARMPTAEFRSVNIGALIGDVLFGYAESCSDIQFNAILDPAIPMVQLDQDQIRRMLMNLLDNAVSAVRMNQVENPREEASITVKLQANLAEDRYSLEVCDTGIGVPEKDKFRVFDPYFTRKKGGTGLGLAIVSSIVSEHEGSIRVLDNVPRGVRFLIDLPIAQKNKNIVNG